jgi:disulfide bond formation protein DsbB
MNFLQVADVLAVLALAANAIVVVTLVMFLASRLSPAGRERWSRVRETVSTFAVPFAFVVATLATTGSLYFQYGGGLTPCLLCWYQRIAMYPLSLLLGQATFRNDATTARTWLLPIPIIGAIISAYHYQLERFPTEHTLSCGYGEPVCSQAPFNIFGFISISYMALSAFLLILTMLLLAKKPAETWEDDEDEDEAESTPPLQTGPGAVPDRPASLVS